MTKTWNCQLGLIWISHIYPHQAIVLGAMKRQRHRRLRTCLSLLALVALLWSQMAFAFHAACVLTPMPLADASASAQIDDHCQTTERAQQALCDAHCAQSDLSKDTSRIPVFGPIVPALALDEWSFVTLRQNHVLVAPRAPHPSWRRPTLHPASILLI